MAMVHRVLAITTAVLAAVQATSEYSTKSGILPWVDPATPSDRQTYTSSRGGSWDLVMSDEFNTEGRSFEPGDDHLWTSMEKADGVNSALEIYQHNMTGTECDDDDTCYFYIEADTGETTLKLWNDYLSPAGYEDVTFYYKGGMVQSWNKFCIQGGMIEVRAQLPGAVTNASGNPDVATGSASVRAATIDYYPTWPGIWMMGNLGRAIFSASTARMWPFSYNECNETVFSSQNQRISACDDDPGSGMNPNQGRGAPEIDILEGGGTAISSSVQVGPGMPEQFRLIADNTSYSCIYTYDCTTEGANNPDVPTAYYEKLRGYKTWYQGLRYGANNFCDSDSTLVQTYKTIAASLEKGITENACTMGLCPASYDVNGDLSSIDNGTDHWGINTNGTCFPKQNAYTGAFLSYTDWLTYQLEWVMGDEGYIRWMLAGEPIFEITADVLTNPPQDAAQMNPKKIMLEEPMYIIFNVALSSTWGTTPPNAGNGDCYGDGSDATTNAICDAFPMYLKIDYIRVYQDKSDDSTMAVGCDPSSHPTKQWIEDNIDSYVDDDNPWTEVSGKAFCESNEDCTIETNSSMAVTTGTCVSGRCKCSATTWTGPRCTVASTASTDSSSNGLFSSNSYGPPMYVSGVFMAITVLTTFVSVYISILAARKTDETLQKEIMAKRGGAAMSPASLGDSVAKPPKDNYSTNFV
ncbi:hypothetical protein PHYSODRAFT_246280 [Phytophthora sojae]|uniref:Beta-glucan synthesis-associated protein n=1 Tax=Phytophthora sojae (strain P6497) TaxID=1094619 RepID=G4YKR9_PHYSP|nr:hypothetical protein PHYSODRAFT_246280 [Phytophthora sojae]EGZ29223.1 hypothetical protein PHYSODRAFT_246280 [Phytophthora sojae]|eukprot:XP_009516498.1 hypothetical protein PHYSODRAFT_246280 [Phytophthora sojae]